jgi:hypothetical protein
MRPKSAPTFRITFSLAATLCLPVALNGQERGEETPIPPSAAASPALATHEASAPVATAARLTQPISIDGDVTDAAWAATPVITTFTQTDPVEGAPVSQRTEVRILYDDDALYIGAILHDTGEITTRLARRDALGESDAFSVTLDSYHDHQTGYRFAVNPAGVRRDELISTGGNDASWDPVWDVATSRTATMWSVEMRIPFSQLRFSRDAVQTWGIQIERTIHRNQESAEFAFTPKLERGGVQRFGHLEGISNIRAGRRFELLPYVTTRAEYIPLAPVAGDGFGNPYRSGSDYFANAGIDMKVGLGSNLTLDATVNPDFGQVEVDPAVINLTAFETRFEERRPFFVEGAEIFRFGQGGPTGSTGRQAEVLYSRRIGRTPQGSTPGTAAFSDSPSSTTILGAARMTGKLGDGWSVGLLQAVTAREEARFAMVNGDRGSVEVEPLTNYVVGRIRRDTNGGRTRIGGIVTAVNRDLSDETLAGRLHSSAYVMGVDLVREWAEGTWRLSSSFSPSLVRGDQAALIRTQQTSSRYFNRPDASHLGVDSLATSLTGYYAMAELNKVAGTWTGRIGLGAASPGYEVNDVGFQSYADRLILDTHFQYAQVRPGRYLRNWNIGGGPDNVWNYAGDHVLSNFNLQGRYTWMNYWGSGWRLEYTPEVHDDRLTRGGPMAKSPRGFLINGNVSTDSRKNYTASLQLSYSAEEGGGYSRSASMNFNLRPRENWEIRIGPGLTRRYTEAQYVTSVADSRAESTFGRRYVFAGLEQTTLSVDARLNVTFTPALSFQLYAQPLLSSGDYDALKELRAPRTFDFAVYGEDVGTITRQEDGHFRIDPVGNDEARSFLVRNQDFSVRSVLGNAVLRWEWRPGSTIYLVWQQAREGRVTGMDPGADEFGVGRLDFGRDARDLLDMRPDNVFALKINYWLNP